MGIAPQGQVVVGAQLHVQQKSKANREPWEPDAGLAEIVEIAAKAEALGFAYVAVCDHVAIPDNDVARHMGATWYDTVATLGYLAASTARVRLLSSVYVPALRHPLAVAKSFATLDHLSGGRVILGVGSGHLQTEFEVMGVDFADRGRLTDESIDAVRAVFAEEWSSFQGEHWKWDRMGVAPRPVQAEIPIWIGGKGRPALRRVAERGDGWIPQAVPRAQMAGDLAYIEEIRQRVRPEAVIDYGWLPEWIYIGDPPFDLGALPHITGSAEEVAESLRFVHELGCTHVQVRLRSRTFAELLDQMDAFGRDVLPLLN